MSIVEKRELEINSETGGSITFVRVGNVVQITRTVYYQTDGGAAPIELDAVDRRALIELLNMGEFRELSYKEAR